MKLITDLQKEENMTREEANKALPTLQAFAEGKVIQMLDDRSIWTDLTEREGLPIETLGESPNIFRIKPAPKYRPFVNAEECWQEMQKHQPFGWLKLKCEDTAYGMLTLIKDKGAAVGIDDTPFSYRYLFYNYTFADRQPFGIKEEV